MITALEFCLKYLYWLVIGWWLEPIKYFRRKKIEKMKNTIIKNEYNKIKEEQKKEEN